MGPRLVGLFASGRGAGRFRHDERDRALAVSRLWLRLAEGGCLMGLYRNIGHTALKFPGHPPYGPREQFRADLSTEQEALLTASGSLTVIEASVPTPPAAPAPVPTVRGPLAAGESATPDLVTAPMTLPRQPGPGDKPAHLVGGGDPKNPLACREPGE